MSDRTDFDKRARRSLMKGEVFVPRDRPPTPLRPLQAPPGVGHMAARRSTRDFHPDRLKLKSFD